MKNFKTPTAAVGEAFLNAVRNDARADVNTLLEIYGTNIVNYQNETLNTALMYAAQRKNGADLVRLLLEAGADPDIKNKTLSDAHRIAHAFKQSASMEAIDAWCTQQREQKLADMTEATTQPIVAKKLALQRRKGSTP